MTIQQQRDILNEILYEVEPYNGNTPKQFTTREFIENILGFEPVE
jgi:hypothetical protein